MVQGIEIVATQKDVKAIYRFIGKLVFIKSNNNQYAAQMIQQFKSKGGKVEVGRTWIKGDLFVDHDWVKLGAHEFNPKTESDENVQRILADFFEKTLNSAKFITRRTEIK